MRHAILFIINLAVFFEVSSCQRKPAVETTSLSRSDLVEAAYRTYANRVRTVNMGENPFPPEIPEQYWAEGIRELKPIKVYKHRVNIVVVQKVRDNVEEGKYICIPVSSYLPMNGVDGFTYQPNPWKGNKYYLGDGVFDYRRTINK